MATTGDRVKGRLVVSFVNEQGMLEAGLDYGGLVKEFLEKVCNLLLSLHVALMLYHVGGPLPLPPN